MHAATGRTGVVYWDTQYQQVTVNDESTIVLTNQFDSCGVWLVWQAQNGYSGVFTSGYNGTTVAHSNYGSWSTSDSNGSGCMLRASTHSLTFKNRLGANADFTFVCYGLKQVYV